MNIFASQTLAKRVLIVAFIVLFLIAVLGLSHFGMNMNADGTMSECPYMGVPTLCTMDIFEHLTMWQQLFSSVIPQFMTLILLLLIAFPLRGLFNDLFTYKPPIARPVFYRREFTIIDSLKLAFARGLIHPKIF